MKNKIVLVAMALLLVAVLGKSMIAAFPMEKGFMNSNLFEEKQVEIQEFIESIQQAIEDKNFEEWKNLIQSQLTQGRFNEIVEMHNQNQEKQQLREQMFKAWENKDYETMKQLREQLQRENMPSKFRNNNGEFHNQQNIKGGKGFFQRFQFWRRE